MHKKILVICIAIIVFASTIASVYADVIVNLPSATTNNRLPIVSALGRTWKTLIVVIQIISIGLVAFSGVRYMFASADKKADIKRRLDLVGDRVIYCFCNINNN